MATMKDKRTRTQLLAEITRLEEILTAKDRSMTQKDGALVERDREHQETVLRFKRDLVNANIARSELKSTLQETALEALKVVQRLLGKTDGLATALKIALKKENEEEGPEVARFTEELGEHIGGGLNDEDIPF